MSAAEKLLPQQLIPIDRIQPSPLNPRKLFDAKALEELAADVRERGVLQAVKVRPRRVGPATTNDEFELVFGERRWRAAKLAGLTHIPATVEELTDDQVLVEQLVENGKRSDFHPLEEADGLYKLHKQFGVAIDELARRIKLDPSSVYARLKLCSLGPVAREALQSNKLSWSHGVELAKIPSPKLQAQATKEVLTGGDDGPLNVRQTKEHVLRHYMLDLVKAPFDTADATLCPRAGACTGCPKRADAQPELFGPKPPALCTDVGCYGQKKEAAWKRTAAAAEKEGRRVLSEEETESVFPESWGGQMAYGAPYVELSSKPFQDAKGRTYKQLLGGDAPVVLARDPKGDVHELVAKDELPKLLEQAGHDFSKKNRGDSIYDAAQKRREKEAKRKNATAELALAAIVAAHEKRRVADDRFWRLIAVRVFSVAGSDAVAVTARRRGLLETLQGWAAVKPLVKLADELEGAELQALVVEVLLAGYARHHAHGGDGYRKELKAACEFFGVDLKKLDAQTKADEQAKAKGKAAGKLPLCRGYDRADGVKVRTCGMRVHPGGTQQCRKCAIAQSREDKKKASVPAKKGAPGSDGAPLSVACPLKSCSAAPGKPCINHTGKELASNDLRAAALALAAPEGK